MFNREVEKGEEAESWLSRVNKYFHIYNYYFLLKGRMAINNLTKKADIWWKYIMRVKNMKEKYFNWRVFKNYFKRRFMSKQYYEDSAREFYDLKIGSTSIKELSSNFLSLLRYIPYIIDEK